MDDCVKIPEQERHGGKAVEGDSLLALSERFLDRAKKTCLLCRRQFAAVEVLEKHATMSGLHKVGFGLGGHWVELEEKIWDESAFLKFRQKFLKISNPPTPTLELNPIAQVVSR